MQTTSLELSKRLHELGFKGESEYMWVCVGGIPPEMKWEVKYTARTLYPHFPALQFHELWEALPGETILDGGLPHTLHQVKTSIGDTFMSYEYTSADGKQFRSINSIHRHKSPTEAAGLLLAWAIEEKHLEVKG